MADTNTGPRGQQLVTNQQWLSDDFNRARRYSQRALQEFAKLLFQDKDDAPLDGVLTGFEVTYSAAMNTAVAAGIGFVHSTSDIADTTIDSPYRWVERFGSGTVTHAAADATHARWDAVYVLWGSGTGGSETRNVKVGGTPTAQATDTYAGTAPTLGVVTGTPSASPVKPSVPAKSILVAYVNVAAGAANLSGAGIQDARTLLYQQLADTTLTGYFTGASGSTMELNEASTSLGNTSMDSARSFTNTINFDKPSSGPCMHIGHDLSTSAAEDITVAKYERGSTGTDAELRFKGVDAALTYYNGSDDLAISTSSGIDAATGTQRHTVSHRLSVTFTGGSTTELVSAAISVPTNFDKTESVITATINSVSGSDRLCVLLAEWNGGNIDVTVHNVTGGNITASSTAKISVSIVGKIDP